MTTSILDDVWRHASHNGILRIWEIGPVGFKRLAILDIPPTRVQLR